MRSNFDRDTYACVNHPTLEPDAWHSVDMGRPLGDGAKAALVCQFSCPARDRCPVIGQEDTDVIAGGGWFNKRGAYIKPPPDEIEIQQAAAYLGITIRTFKYLATRDGIHLVRRVGPATMYPLEAVHQLSKRVGPSHGTAARLELHQLLGQDCAQCSSILANV